MGAEKLLAAEKKGKKIAVEIKSFLGKSIISEAQDAIGQFMMYREVLLDSQPERTLFLAVGKETFDIEFSENLKDLICERLKMKVLIYNVETEEIEKWLT